MKRAKWMFVLLLAAQVSRAQFAPQAMVRGSTAISKNSGQFVGWATGCHVRRGFQQIDNPSLGYASAGDSSLAIGFPNGNIVSLGDSGVAMLTFARPIINGPGADFAVFENGFANPANPEEAFLELAFVEVSSDGANFFRFLATSNTQDTQQITAAGDYMNARLLNNLAGKYIGGWGTPFDLQELAGIPGLDVNAITHVRLIDVIGSIGAMGSRDAFGHKINDPFPTPFPGSGFDLDAVGVLHEAPAGVTVTMAESACLYPNPAADELTVLMPANVGPASIKLHDAAGRIIRQEAQSGRFILSLKGLAPGVYYLTIRTQNGESCTRAFLHR